MSNNNYFAVRKGRTRGIFTSSEEAMKQVKQFAGAEHSKFRSHDDAFAYMNSNSEFRSGWGTKIHTGNVRLASEEERSEFIRAGGGKRAKEGIIMTGSFYLVYDDSAFLVSGDASAFDTSLDAASTASDTPPSSFGSEISQEPVKVADTSAQLGKLAQLLAEGMEILASDVNYSVLKAPQAVERSVSCEPASLESIKEAQPTEQLSEQPVDQPEPKLTKSQKLKLKQKAKKAAAKAERERLAQEAIKSDQGVDEEVSDKKAPKEAAEMVVKESEANTTTLGDNVEREAKESTNKEKPKREDKEKAEREAKDKAEVEAKAKADCVAKEKAKREADEREAKEKAAKEKAEREAKEKAEQEAKEKAEADRVAKEQAKREADKLAAKEKAAKEKAEREAKEKAEREAVEKAEREAEDLAQAEIEAARKRAEEILAIARKKVEDAKKAAQAVTDEEPGAEEPLQTSTSDDAKAEKEVAVPEAAAEAPKSKKKGAKKAGTQQEAVAEPQQEPEAEPSKKKKKKGKKATIPEPEASIESNPQPLSKPNGKKESGGDEPKPRSTEVKANGKSLKDIPKPSKPINAKGATSLVVFTDGHTVGDQKHAKAGYGVFFGDRRDKFDAIPENCATGSELWAVKEALMEIKRDHRRVSYRIVTSSDSTRNAIGAWGDNWEKNGWKTKAGEDVDNANIIKFIRTMIEECRRSGVNVSLAKGQGDLELYGTLKAIELATKGSELPQRVKDLY